MRFLDHLQPLGLLILRLALGVVMVDHGYPKVFGGLQAYYHVVQGLGLPGWLAFVSAFAEFLGGLLLIFGLLTRISALAVFLDLLIAIVKVNWQHGLSTPSPQLPLVMAAIAFALIFYGAGPIALDGVLFRPAKGGGKK